MGPPPAALQEDRIPLAWLARLIGRAMALYLRLVAATARTSGPPVVQGQALFAIWHESNLVAATAAFRLRTDEAGHQLQHAWVSRDRHEHDARVDGLRRGCPA